jgi:predicted nucleic acid-binding protein
MLSFLIDTNVLVYLYDANAPEKHKMAEKILNSLQQFETACLSAQSLAEFTSVALRKLNPPLTPAQAYEQVTLLIELWPILHLTPQIVLEATRGMRDHHLAYYDAQIWACARLNQIPTVLSEDFQDGLTLEGIRFVNPFTEGFDVDVFVS